MNRDIHIALVEDDQCSNAALTELLALEGFDNVLSFGTGAAFFAHYHGGGPAPDIAFLDMSLPDCSGFTILQTALEAHQFSRTVFVCVSGIMNASDENWLGYVGFDGFLRKPPEIGALMDWVHKVVSTPDEILAKRQTYKNLFEAISELSKLRVRTRVLEQDYIKKLIAPEVFAALESHPDRLRPRITDVSVGFVDIRGFTQLMNRLEINQISELLSEFFDRACALIAKHHGQLDKFVGDSVMWIHTGSDAAAAARGAIEVAVEIVQNTRRITQGVQRRLHHRVTFQAGAGVASGSCAIGLMGAKQYRIQHSVIGPAVNLAARLASIARPGEVLIGGTIIEYCTRRSQSLGFQAIKGFDHDVEVRRVAGINSRTTSKVR